MNRNTLNCFACRPRAERGTVLIIALIVLVAMTLAGIATMRSVDTATLMAGNIAFRQSAVSAADQGIQAGYAWVSTNFTIPGGLDDDNLAAGYSSNAPPIEPNWLGSAAWTGAFQLNGGAPDAAGNYVWYKIERMCPVKACPANDSTCTGGANICGSTPDTGALSKEGQDHFRPTRSGAFSKPPAVHYRVTAKAEGPRKSISIVQVMLRGV